MNKKIIFKTIPRLLRDRITGTEQEYVSQVFTLCDPKYCLKATLEQLTQEGRVSATGCIYHIAALNPECISLV